MRNSGAWAAARQARVAVSLCFMIMGLTNGAWVARIPAVKAQAHLSDAMLGVTLFAVPVGLLLGAAAAERLVDRVGSARVAWVSGVVLSLVIVMPGLARNAAELMVVLLAVGVSGGMLDVAQNAQGVRVENAYRRSVMNSLHACFSLGSIIGALAGGGFAWAGVGPLPSLAAAGLTGAVVIGVAGHWFLAEPEMSREEGSRQEESREREPRGEEHRAGERREGSREEEPRTEERRAGEHRAGEPRAGGRRPEERLPVVVRRSRRQTWRLVIALGVLGICAMVGEGAAGDWSAVYLKDNLGTSSGFAALGFAAFSVTMTAGRLAGDRLVHRFGAPRLVRGCGLVAAAGLAGGLLSRDPAGAVAGFAVLGAGLSVIVPQVFAAGGRADPEHPGSGLAKVVGLGYAGLASGPAVIGAVANRVGLPLALGIPVMLTLWVAAAAPVLAGTGGQRVAVGGVATHRSAE